MEGVTELEDRNTCLHLIQECRALIVRAIEAAFWFEAEPESPPFYIPKLPHLPTYNLGPPPQILSAPIEFPHPESLLISTPCSTPASALFLRPPAAQPPRRSTGLSSPLQCPPKVLSSALYSPDPQKSPEDTLLCLIWSASAFCVYHLAYISSTLVFPKLSCRPYCDQAKLTVLQCVSYHQAELTMSQCVSYCQIHIDHISEKGVFPLPSLKLTLFKLLNPLCDLIGLFWLVMESSSPLTGISLSTLSIKANLWGCQTRPEEQRLYCLIFTTANLWPKMRLYLLHTGCHTQCTTQNMRRGREQLRSVDGRGFSFTHPHLRKFLNISVKTGNFGHNSILWRIPLGDPKATELNQFISLLSPVIRFLLIGPVKFESLFPHVSITNNSMFLLKNHIGSSTCNQTTLKVQHTWRTHKAAAGFKFNKDLWWVVCRPTASQGGSHVKFPDLKPQGIVVPALFHQQLLPQKLAVTLLSYPSHYLKTYKTAGPPTTPIFCSDLQTSGENQLSPRQTQQ
ncbi:hypothetical protein VP01_3805g1 [Puccinia sorghi]|uniref:Uncharacterized protein n=1 Tax=Puccinia sorghi TaxID=27349 RepID=A0A0L6UTD9_9BASI|nr:hypothetical protein VP01_3805g1 [Puccinia sorghi]